MTSKTSFVMNAEDKLMQSPSATRHDLVSVACENLDFVTAPVCKEAL